MRGNKPIISAIFSGILLSVAWYEKGPSITLLFAWIPLLFVEEHLYLNRQKYVSFKAFLYSALTFLSWNLITTWWIVNASPAGMLLAVFINTLLMSGVFWLFHFSRRKLGSSMGYFSLLVYWLSYEYFYLNAEISWPWLNLGNGLANDILLIQWYEYTGTLGGTCWILLVNIILFHLIKEFIRSRKSRKTLYLGIVLSVFVLVPPAVSFLIFKTYHEEKNPCEIVVLQPNIDPYEEKFGGLPPEEQMDILLRLADSLGTPATDYFVAPETFINDNVWEQNMHINPSILAIRSFLEKYPGAKFVVGLTSYKRYRSRDEIPPTASKIPGTNIWYDSFNSSIQIDSTDNIQIYRKSKLVAGVEKMPYPRYLRFLEKLTLRLGGTFRSHGTQKNRECLFSPGDSKGIGTAICYESVFGEFVTEYVKAGANLIFVITNDGWWGDTPGYRQHHGFSRIRAIETRRSIARSANTGISSFINQKGEILCRTEYWVPDAIRCTLNASREKTFYVRHGDFMARIAGFFSILMILYTLVSSTIRRFK